MATIKKVTTELDRPVLFLEVELTEEEHMAVKTLDAKVEVHLGWFEVEKLVKVSEDGETDASGHCPD